MVSALLHAPAPPAPPPPVAPAAQRGVQALTFCALRTAARFYAAPRSCDCGCATCDCTGYWACWGCDADAGGTDNAPCRYSRYFQCEAAPQSTFLDAAQACGWARATANIFACPPPARSPPPPGRPQLPPLPPLPKPQPPRAPYPPFPPYWISDVGGPSAGSCVGACGRCLQESASGAFLCCCDAPCMTWRAAPGQPPGYLGCCRDFGAACPAGGAPAGAAGALGTAAQPGMPPRPAGSQQLPLTPATPFVPPPLPMNSLAG
jgi:hypothetical protein